MSTPSLILHLGPPKTATTTLQRHVFPQLNFIDYRGKFDHRYLSHDPLYIALYQYVVDGKGSLEAIRERIQNALATATHPILLSEENWTKGTFQPGGQLSKEKIHRLHQATSGFNVLVLYALRPMKEASFSAFVQFQAMHEKTPQPIAQLIAQSDALFPYRYHEARTLLDEFWPQRVFPLDFYELAKGKIEFPGFQHHAASLPQSNRTGIASGGAIAHIVRKRYFAQIAERIAPIWPKLAQAMWQINYVEKVFVPNWTAEQLESVKHIIAASDEAREQWLSDARRWIWTENGLETPND